MMNFLVLLLFILFSFPKSFAGNLANCYEATDAKEESNVKECKVEGGGTQKLVYPQKDKSGVPIAGCYSLTFQRVSDIPGDPVTGKCESSNAPIRYYLKYRTVCSNGKASCRYGRDRKSVV